MVMLWTTKANHALYIGSLPTRARCRENFADAHVSHLFSEVIAKDSIAVAQQVAGELGGGKGLPQLLSRPLGGWVGDHIEVQNATPVMSQNQKHVGDLETDSGHGEEVDGDQLLGVILQECAPGLRRRFAAAHHVFVDAALRDADAEFEQFAVDARSTPAGILPAHLEDQISDLTSREMTGRPSWSRRTFQVQKKRKPARCQATTVSGLTMPSASHARGGKDRYTTVGPRGQFRTFCCGPLKHADFVAQSQVLKLESSTRTEDRAQNSEEGRERNEHRREL